MSAKKIMRADLLVEIGTEELPPAALSALAEAFAGGLARELAAAGVADDAERYRVFATPRRLTAVVFAVAGRQPDSIAERRGPALKAAYDATGKPSRAAAGFAKSCGVAVADLDTMETAQGAWLVHRQQVAGASLATVAAACIERSLRQMPIPKRMRWGDGAAEFVRPAHWLLALHGDKVVATQALGLQAGRVTYGHRFHADRAVSIPQAEKYADLLESDGRVIADFARRRDLIVAQIETLAGLAGARADLAPGLLDWVTGAVEWPRAVRGEFDRRFLALPDEVLISAMREHQKYFHLYGVGDFDGDFDGDSEADDGAVDSVDSGAASATESAAKLLPMFITVSNIDIPRGDDRVRRGNERVLRARLADAEFFWTSALKIPLERHAEKLGGVVFHQKLGSVRDKCTRVGELARHIAAQASVDGEQAERAALLCKADLVTDLVGEFPDLQGVIGRHCAQKSGEAAAVADAMEQHYWPRYAGDQLPRGGLAQCLAVADRLDSMLGLFAAGEIPSGDKDPFAQRRAALGVLRILIEKGRDWDLLQLLRATQHAYERADNTTARPDAATVRQVFDFMLERLTAYYLPLGHGAELPAVLACKPRRPLDVHQRLTAVRQFRAQQPQAAAALAAANKRIARILRKAGGDSVDSMDMGGDSIHIDGDRDDSAIASGVAGPSSGQATGPSSKKSTQKSTGKSTGKSTQKSTQKSAADDVAPVYQAALFQHAAEHALAQQLESMGAQARAHFAERRYDLGLAASAGLKQPVDEFFAQVMVMADDAAVRDNRLALLRHIRRLFLGVADLSLLPSERE